MRILHIEDRFHPTMGYQINFMARYHNPSDTFFILTSNSFSIWNGLTPAEMVEKDSWFEETYKVKIVRLPATFADGQKSNIWLKGLKKGIKDINPDVVFLHCLENYTTFRLLFRYSQKRYKIVTDTHTLYNQFRGGLKEKLYFFLHRILVVKQINRHRIPCFYTVHENHEIMIQQYGIDPKLLFPCPIGSDPAIFRFDLAERERLRTSYQIGRDDTIILYTGKLNARKKPHLILKAVEILANNIANSLVLFFVGSRQPDYYSAHFHYAFDNSFIRVIELPAVANHELFQYYSMADVAVFPAENTLSALDAQLCKLPVVMARDTTNEERLSHGGLLFEQGNLNDLAEKMEKLINDKGLRNKLAEEGYTYVLNDFNYSDIVKNAEEIIHKTVIRV